MIHPLDIGIAGYAVLGPEPEVPLPLDELIYRVTSQALASSGLGIDDIGGACMAASDLNDGRAISTMTLTGSTGSFGKTEMRVCNDSLAAIQVGAAEIGAGASRAIMVCSWSKLSDTRPQVIAPLAMEPAMHRPLGFHPAALVGLGLSRTSRTVTLTRPAIALPCDVAAAVVLVAPDHDAPTVGRVRGYGGSMGAYLSSRGELMEPLRAAVERACRHAEVRLDDLVSVTVAGVHDIPDEELANFLGVDSTRLRRQGNRTADLGYAAGLRTLLERLEPGNDTDPGTHLVCSAAGVALENTHAIVMEKR